ncbi:MAG: 4-hydroxythreonine-4-phosphate dehydrogenase PdxA [Bacteroides sp.]|nr:MAG: 4-hydroxythreonine-4-phosphate dehydrogenase PdxA [Bacteroides sp.]
MKFIPKIGISSGDPNGIGLELVIKLFDKYKYILKKAIIILYCSENIFSQYLKCVKNDIDYKAIDDICKSKIGIINIYNPWNNIKTNLTLGIANKLSGKLSFESLNCVLKHVSKSYLNAIITLPINKYYINNSQFQQGHTEYLQKYFMAKDTLMLMVGKKLKIGLITNHVKISNIIKEINVEKILSKLYLLNKGLSSLFNIKKPKIALLSINPHIGDNGLIGNEDNIIVEKAIKIASENNLQVFGPFAADSFFAFKQYTQFDAVLAMYHDQGLIPFKYICHNDGINITLGVPIIRISPDHGPAYDISGKNISDINSFKSSITNAIKLSNNVKKLNITI